MNKLAAEGKFEDQEDARATQLYSMAWENFRSRPEIFFRRLADGAQAFVTEFPGLLWDGYGPLEEPDWLLRNALTAIAVIGLLYGAARGMKAVELTFWALFWVSIVVSSSFVYFDDGPRALAASHPMMALFFAIGMSNPATASEKSPARTRSIQYGVAGLFAASVLFVCVPWISYRFSSIRALVNSTPLQKENETFVFGGRRMSGFLVVGDDMQLRSDVPSIHLADFDAIVRQSGVEFYQGLIHPVLPPLPFGFVFTPRIERGSSSQYQYIVPAKVVEHHNILAWHFDLDRWGHKPGFGDYWFYVTKAQPWP